MSVDGNGSDRLEAPPYTRKLIRSLWLAASALVWLGYVAFRYPQIDPEEFSIYFRPTPLTSLPFALVLGYGIAMLAGLAWVNWHRPYSILRFTRGHAIGTVILILLTPLLVVNWIPWIFGGWFIFYIGVDGPGNSGPAYGILALLVICCYPIAVLLVSGIRDRRLRVAAFALVFWAVYCALILWGGVMDFDL